MDELGLAVRQDWHHLAFRNQSFSDISAICKTGGAVAGIFELFHLSLLPMLQGNIFQASPVPSREEWLREAFEKTFKFHHRKVECHWVPQETGTQFITGNVVRLHARRHHKPPEEGAFEVLGKEWQGAIVIIDPTHHDDGQKVSFERDATLGAPKSVLQSMCAHINLSERAPYVIEPKPIFNEAQFWAWAAGHGYRMRRISFEFVAPNMFGSKNAFDEDMAELGQSGVTTARVAFDSGGRAGGIDAQNEQIRSGVDYAAQGGGSIRARAENGDDYSSTRNTRIARLPKSIKELGGEIKALTKWLPLLLGREQNAVMDGDARDIDGPIEH